VARVLKVYETARLAAVADPKAVTASLVAATKLPDTVIARQLERTGLTYGPIGKDQVDTIVAAGLALQQAGVLDAALDIKAVTAGLVEPKYLAGKPATQ
jgi:sulfonate transport system substrate-binding protein